MDAYNKAPNTFGLLLITFGNNKTGQKIEFKRQKIISIRPKYSLSGKYELFTDEAEIIQDIKLQNSTLSEQNHSLQNFICYYGNSED